MFRPTAWQMAGNIINIQQSMDAADGRIGKCTMNTAPIVPEISIEREPFPIREVQTDNGSEFTNRLLVIKSKHLTMFKKALEELGILYHRIQIATPRHNGKVEHQHRTDEARFYKSMRMYSLEDGRKQLAVYQRKSNNYIKTCLGMKSPNAIVKKYQGVMF